MDRILRVTGPRQTTNPPFLLSSFSPVGETCGRGRTDPAHPLGPVSAAVAAHLPRPSEGALPGRAARCTSASAAVYLMLIPAARRRRRSQLCCCCSIEKGRRRRRAATDSDGWLLAAAAAAGRGENCRATTDDNAPSPEMIRIIWENYSPVKMLAFDHKYGRAMSCVITPFIFLKDFVTN